MTKHDIDVLTGIIEACVLGFAIYGLRDLPSWLREQLGGEKPEVKKRREAA